MHAAFNWPSFLLGMVVMLAWSFGVSLLWTRLRAGKARLDMKLQNLGTLLAAEPELHSTHPIRIDLGPHWAS